jgi:CHASE3 domain sensor protein
MWTFGRKIAAGFTVAFLLLLGIGGVAYRSLNLLANTSHTVTHTHEVLERVANVLSLLSGTRWILAASPALCLRS